MSGDVTSKGVPLASERPSLDFPAASRAAPEFRAGGFERLITATTPFSLFGWFETCTYCVVFANLDIGLY
jgi:hypothetical protein